MKLAIAMLVVACGGATPPPTPPAPPAPQYSDDPPAGVVFNPVVVATITRTWVEDDGETRFEVDKGRDDGLDHRMKAKIVLDEGRTVIEPIHILHVRGSSVDLRTSSHLPDGIAIEVQFQHVFIDAKITRMQVRDGGQLITCLSGSDQGVHPRGSAKLLSRSREIADLQIARVAARFTDVMLYVTFDQIPPDLRVRFYPPTW